MADPTPVGTPIAVTLLEQPLFNAMANAATMNGTCLLSAACVVSPTECFQMLGLNVTDQDDLPVIIVNGLDKPLKRTQYIDVHSAQKQYPVKTDGSGTATFEPDVIPGARAHPYKPEVLLYGAGAYCFTKTARGFFWNDGAMEFADMDGGHKFAVAWSCDTPTGVAAVATDLTAYKSDLQTFYDQTASGNNAIATSSGTDFTVDVAPGNVTLMLYDPNPSKNQYDPYVVTYLIVSVRPK
jgi:hypothetical protein